MNYQQIINNIYHKVKTGKNGGEVASYIPELAKISPDKFGVHLVNTANETFGVGDCHEKFSIQSIAKVLSLTMAYQQFGGDLWDRVGVEPSGNPFNSLVQLESDNGIPRNPFINAGALVICDFLVSHLKNPKVELLNFIRQLADNETINFNTAVAESEWLTGHRNYALINYIKSFGNIKNDCREVLELYFHLCSIEMTCAELARTFLFLANHGQKISNNARILTTSRTKRINAIMLTCGFYDESGEFAYKVGLPGKSGVGGGIVAIYPNEYSIAVWSPRLNKKGNSYRGVRFLEQFTTETELSIF